MRARRGGGAPAARSCRSSAPAALASEESPSSERWMCTSRQRADPAAARPVRRPAASRRRPSRRTRPRAGRARRATPNSAPLTLTRAKYARTRAAGRAATRDRSGARPLRAAPLRGSGPGRTQAPLRRRGAPRGSATRNPARVQSSSESHMKYSPRAASSTAWKLRAWPRLTGWRRAVAEHRPAPSRAPRPPSRRVDAVVRDHDLERSVVLGEGGADGALERRRAVVGRDTDVTSGAAPVMATRARAGAAATLIDTDASRGSRGTRRRGDWRQRRETRDALGGGSVDEPSRADRGRAPSL